METAPQRSSPEHALAAVADCLRCPHCGGDLALEGRSLACPAGHRYDIAREGYVSLPRRHPSPHIGDSGEMVAAREAFLDAGHYAPIADALAQHGGGDLVVDLGVGTGYYLGRLAGARRLGLDASRRALRRAVRRDPGIAGVACDVWQPLPLKDGVADLAVCVFAPRNGPEFARILAPGGSLVVVTPTPRHLQALRAAVPGMLDIPADKPARLRTSLGPGLSMSSSETVEFAMRLPRAQARMIVVMGPSAGHVGDEELELPPTLSVTASVTVETFRRSLRGYGGGQR